MDIQASEHQTASFGLALMLNGSFRPLEVLTNGTQFLYALNLLNRTSELSVVVTFVVVNTTYKLYFDL